MIKRNTREQRAPMSEYDRKQWRLVLAELSLLGFIMWRGRPGAGGEQ